MSLPDNRVRFPAARLNFSTAVGTTGQDHDNYPAPDQQPRYDWLRMYLIGLLSSQSSHHEPGQHRDGTLWFDLNTLTLKIFSDSTWRSVADVIGIVEGDSPSTTTSLAQWYAAIQAQLTSTAPEATFSGYCTENNTTIINVPDSIKDNIDADRSRPIVYKNGLLLDPRDCEFFTSATIKLKNGTTLDKDDEFTVMVKNITPTLFHIPDVIVP